MGYYRPARRGFLTDGRAVGENNKTVLSELKHTGVLWCRQGLESVVMIVASNESEEESSGHGLVHGPLPSQLEGSSCPLVVR